VDAAGVAGLLVAAAHAEAAAANRNKGLMRSVSVVLSVVVCAAAFATSPGTALLAQHETAADLLDGERAYGAGCVTCHGPDGNQVAGIDLFRGQFRRPYTDQELVGIIRNGIPNTAMAGTSLSQEQASKLVAYLRSMATKKSTAATGDAARGRAVFDGKGGCAGCHRVNGIGSRVGPDLSRVGGSRRALELERSLLDPAADVQPTNRTYRVVTREGTAITGRLLSHDTFTVQMIDSKEQLRSFVKADLREHGFAATTMPSYKGKLSTQEIADLVSYLVTLREASK
jgi:putative heme-binding domain-containing protein